MPSHLPVSYFFTFSSHCPSSAGPYVSASSCKIINSILVWNMNGINTIFRILTPHTHCPCAKENNLLCSYQIGTVHYAHAWESISLCLCHGRALCFILSKGQRLCSYSGDTFCSSQRWALHFTHTELEDFVALVTKGTILLRPLQNIELATLLPSLTVFVSRVNTLYCTCGTNRK